MHYQLDQIIAAPPQVSMIQNHRAFAVAAFAVYRAAEPHTDLTVKVPLTIGHFNDQQSIGFLDEEEIDGMLPEILVFDREIYEGCLRTNDELSVRFDWDKYRWVPNGHIWEKSLAYRRSA